MSKFEQDRKIEKEASAIKNYFVLLAKAELAAKQTTINHEQQIEIFNLINGEDNIRELIVDCKEENIDIFNNDVEALYNKLENNIKIINSLLFSKSGLTERTIKMFDTIENIYAGGYGVYTTPRFINRKDSAFEQLKLLPIPEKAIYELSKLKSVEKNLGEK